ncbi:TPA: hypothetical protein VDV13_001616 [Pseudomonas aeruginosa]|uniref:hypothetical protein n=1 Tax=Pseudomonas aeruginosa TaxID=287 RepID=UPI00157B7823|nr:hypothetical protein [Pseudomonas aeruginosa]MDP5424402.1 hypothetical protein [Pseudomonas aeruginosa]HBO2483051.1 hypothetical protein [Pseudomonas aeruginosa]HCK7375954.1 hypothetical protein [Pseudomonas aeruginosa]HDV4085064.1 hypothetical protein [Pseudomonas aeruginosa]HEP9117124.1 hypothetical protein [Pseudomonas aeruginosa]
MSRGKLIIDTNLLLLLVIGAVEEGRHIRNSNRLNGFDILDYNVVLEVIKNHKEVFITHYIATEVSNLIDLKGHASELAYNVARVLFSQFTQIESDVGQDCELENFLFYGITDSSLVRLAPEYTILTNDNRLLGPLFDACEKNIIPFEVAKTTYLA